MTIDLGFIGLMHYLKDSQILGAMASYSRYSKDCMADETRLPAILLQTYTPTIRHAPPKCEEKVVEVRTVAVHQKKNRTHNGVSSFGRIGAKLLIIIAYY